LLHYTNSLLQYSNHVLHCANHLLAIVDEERSVENAAVGTSFPGRN
jgi:hypothetical protein